MEFGSDSPSADFMKTFNTTVCLNTCSWNKTLWSWSTKSWNHRLSRNERWSRNTRLDSDFPCSVCESRGFKSLTRLWKTPECVQNGNDSKLNGLKESITQSVETKQTGGVTLQFDWCLIFYISNPTRISGYSTFTAADHLIDPDKLLLVSFWISPDVNIYDRKLLQSLFLKSQVVNKDVLQSATDEGTWSAHCWTILWVKHTLHITHCLTTTD